MVTHQAELAPLRDQARAFVGLSPVADHVAEAPAVLDPGLVNGLEDRLESGQVRVDVGEDGDAHETSGQRLDPGPENGGLS